MGDVDWDERYAGHDQQMWSGRANGVLLVEIAGAAPGRALDVGCGEGADAMWLASQGWQVTAVDVSRVALDRAEVAARAAGLTVDWVQSDVVVTPPDPGAYDLVSVHYPALLRTPDDDAIRGLLAAVAPQGTLLAVGHWPIDAEHARARGFDPADYVHVADVAAHLDDGWTIEVDETRLRVDPAPEGTPHTHDTVLKARRRP
ncbi:MAG: class I SAM-dependent methyltransferase [Acidimicrobiales bacterium]